MRTELESFQYTHRFTTRKHEHKIEFYRINGNPAGIHCALYMKVYDAEENAL
jgi:hypothetical protein